MKQGADWLAWSLQFIAGLVIGGLLGFGVMTRRRSIGGGSGFWVPFDQVVIFALGAAFLGAALASYYGDRLWLGTSYRAIPPDGVEHNHASRVASIMTGVLGGVLVLIALLRYLQVF